jgi:hypothetical protein
MPNAYKGWGTAPAVCYSNPIAPDLGNNPPSGSPPQQHAVPMITPANPFQPCGPSSCSTSTCCNNGTAPSGGAGSPPSFKA